jgi:hypothetical protein
MSPGSIPAPMWSHITKTGSPGGSDVATPELRKETFVENGGERDCPEGGMEGMSQIGFAEDESQSSADAEEELLVFECSLPVPTPQQVHCCSFESYS